MIDSNKYNQKLLQFNWEILTNLSYSPDIASLDYSFWSSKKFLNKNFKSFLQKTTRTLCLEKKLFLEDGIMKLSER